MKILRGQGVARLVQQAASGLLVVVQVLGLLVQWLEHVEVIKQRLRRR
jgi:hypothetical protein